MDSQVPAGLQLTLYLMYFVFNHLRMLNIYFLSLLYLTRLKKYMLEHAVVSLSSGVNSLTQGNRFNPGTGEAVRTSQ